MNKNDTLTSIFRDKRLALSALCCVLSAAMAGSIASGAPLSILFLHFAPLPLMLAGLAFPLPYTIGATAFLMVFLASFSAYFSALFMVGIALPSLTACYVATKHYELQLRLKIKNTAPEQTSTVYYWHNSGTILTILALNCAITAVFAVFTLGYPLDELVSHLIPSLEAMKTMKGVPPEVLQILENDEMRTAFALAIPVGGTAIWLSAMMICLYCAARLARYLHILQRPWLDLAHEYELNTIAIVITAAVLACVMLPNPIGYFAQFFAVVFLILWAIAGAAVVHVFARQTPMPMLALTIFYLLLTLASWLILPMALVGVFDALLGLRTKYGNRPSISSPSP